MLSIDVGTSGVRVALFDEDGNQIEGAQAVTRRAVSDFAELDPDALVDEVIKTVDALLTLPVDEASQIEAIAISTFWHSLVGVDAAGVPTTPLLTWADTRAVKQATELRAEFDEQEIHARTGCRFHPSYWPAKLHWLKVQQPNQFKTTKEWLGFGEYLCFRLFGEPLASVSMASATGLFDQQACDWDWAFSEELGVFPDQLPLILKDETLPLTDTFRRRWPALADARLVIVVGDGAANNIGGGCSTKENIALMIGTSGAMRVVFAGEPPATVPPSLWTYRVSRERIVVGGALSDGGGLLQWLVQRLNTSDHIDTLQQQLAALEPDAHGLTILPFWSGERSTGWLADAHGGIFGLRQQTTTVEIIRAALEAVAYRFALIANALDEIAPAAKVIATGNALRSSPVWLQIIADVLGRPVLFGGSPEASIRGAALLALEAVGKIANIEAVPVFVDEVFEPDMQRHARYGEGLARQQDLYDRLFRN
ncbi:MAG TPA: gluconokinase [Pyrinomonadaceae bacterium]